MSIITFAIETSCDETSAAILKNGNVLSNVIYSQLIHNKYGGIVPELASRAHIKKIDLITTKAFEESGIKKDDISLVAATQGPGLIGSLLVGYNFAKAFSIGANKKFIGINHIESHVYSCFIRPKANITFPFLALIISGGHTLLILVNGFFEHKLLGQTQDDAAGEAFDKVAKMLGLSYPGGPEIDKLAKEGNENFHKFPVSYVKENIYDFSFSGIKTSVLYFLRKNYQITLTPSLSKEERRVIPIADICASFQKAILDSLIEKTMLAANNFGVKHIAISGGVSANSKLREEFTARQKTNGITVYFPEPEYSTDNAAMIGYTAYLKFTQKRYTDSDYRNFLNAPAFARLDYENF